MSFEYNLELIRGYGHETFHTSIFGFSAPLDFESADIYCSADFKLSDPETFDRVIPLHRRRLCPNLIEIFTKQSDQLSQHLDAVELAIVNHVCSMYLYMQHIALHLPISADLVPASAAEADSTISFVI